MTCGQLPLGGCWLPITHTGKCVNPEVAELVWEQMQDRLLDRLERLTPNAVANESNSMASGSHAYLTGSEDTLEAVADIVKDLRT